MREYIIKEADEGQALKKYVGKVLPKAPTGVIQKAFRKKNIDLNGGKATGNESLKAGDKVKIWFSDETFSKFMSASEKIKDKALSDARPEVEKKDLSKFKRGIIYEDKNVIIMNKPAGLLSQGDSSGDTSLNDLLVGYYDKKGGSRVFKPSVVNRLDRNTSGIVLGGMSHKGLDTLSRLIRDREIKKLYRCIIFGELKGKSRIKGWIIRDESENKVTVYEEKPSGIASSDLKSLEIETEYEPVSVITHKGITMTELSVSLITGRHHQIRAHLGFLGHPVMGDIKYGNKDSIKASESLGLTRQLLHAHSIRFPAIKGELAALSNKEFSAPFPDDMNGILKYR